MATKFLLSPAHARELRGMKFQENPFNGSCNSAEHVIMSPSKAPLITDETQSNLHHLKRTYVGVSGKICPVQQPIQPKQVLCSHNKVPLILVRSQPNLVFFLAYASRMRVVTFQGISSIG
jgi:hypothetical protein